MKISISLDDPERYYISGSGYGKEVEISEKDFEWVMNTLKEYSAVQDFLDDKWVKFPRKTIYR